DVAEDVGQLQRDTEVQGVGARASVPAAEDSDADQADSGRDAPAILYEIVERLVARPVEVHLDAVDDVGKRLPRQVEPGEERLQPASLIGDGRATVEDTGQLAAPERYRRAAGRKPVSRSAFLVNGIVNRAAEIPDGNDRLALVGRQDEKRIVEAGLSRHQAWPGQRIARQRSSGTSLPWSVGR